MRYRRIALMVALSVTVDLTNPFIGGAFNFYPEESVDGLSPSHEPLFAQAARAARRTPSDGDQAGIARPAPARPSTARLLDGWLAQMRQGHAPHSDPQSPTEDH